MYKFFVLLQIKNIYLSIINKLELLGLRGAVLDLVKNYLSNRVQTAKFNDTLSDKKSLNIGVPQGSILGPLFFI